VLANVASACGFSLAKTRTVFKCSQIPFDWLADKTYSCSWVLLNVQPFTSSPLTPVLGVHTKVSYPPKLVVMVTTSESPPPHEVTISVDNSKAGLGSTSTFTSTIGEAQPNSPTKMVFGRYALVAPKIEPAGAVAANIPAMP